MAKLPFGMATLPMGRRPLNSTLVLVAFLLATLILVLISPLSEGSVLFQADGLETDTDTDTEPPSAGKQWSMTAVAQSNIHILLPATRSNVNLCKTLLTLAILGYPTPHIVAWGDDDAGPGLLGGGSHFAKITRTLEYVNDEDRLRRPGFEDELVFMIDSFDVWFQLPVDVLVSRYEALVREENARVAQRMGRAHKHESIHSPIIFGAGKRCGPNEPHTVACYPVPESPLPHDLYKDHTDTLVGRTTYSSFRTRYLISGYVIGPVRHMRPMLERAAEKLAECVSRNGASFDTGSGASDYCYHGSDQSIFVEMMGEQELHREVMRRHHRTFLDRLLDLFVTGRPGSRPPPTQIHSTPIADYLNPGFTHQPSDPSYVPGKPYEFGIGLDYWSALGHQTSNAESDTRYIRHDKPLAPQVGEQGMFDCSPRAPMPDDLPNGALELLGRQEPDRWETLPLYTDICTGQVPVLIHHNSVQKAHRETQWDSTWWHGRSRQLLEEQRRRGLGILTHGVKTDKGSVLSWEELCPLDVEPELFRDVGPTP